MQKWTIRAATLGVLGVVALVGAGVGLPAEAAPVSQAAPDAFSGPLDPQAVVRSTPRDTTPVSRLTLRRVPCAVGTASCFVAR